MRTLIIDFNNEKIVTTTYLNIILCFRKLANDLEFYVYTIKDPDCYKVAEALELILQVITLYSPDKIFFEHVYLPFIYLKMALYSLRTMLIINKYNVISLEPFTKYIGYENDAMLRTNFNNSISYLKFVDDDITYSKVHRFVYSETKKMFINSNENNKTHDLINAALMIKYVESEDESNFN